MANAKHDSNQNTVIIAESNTDGNTIVQIKINPTTHVLQTADGGGGSDQGGSITARADDNGEESMLAVSNSDGTSTVGLYADSLGNLLVQST
jgi:hypothetical protein